MSLTREEVILAARAARDYPPGTDGDSWFSGPFARQWPDDVLESHGEGACREYG